MIDAVIPVAVDGVEPIQGEEIALVRLRVLLGVPEERVLQILAGDEEGFTILQPDRLDGLETLLDLIRSNLRDGKQRDRHG